LCSALSLAAAAYLPVDAQADRDAGTAVDAVVASSPEIVAPSKPSSLDGVAIAPSFADLGATTGVLETEGSLTESMISTEPSAGFAFGTGWGYVSVLPLRTSPEADTAAIVNDAAAVFEGTAPGADTIIRPTALGVSTYTQIRSDMAPESYAWRLSLPGGQELKKVEDGSVAIVAAPSILLQGRRPP